MFTFIARGLFTDSALQLISARLRSSLLGLKFKGKDECSKQFLLVATITGDDGIRLDVLEKK
jgi:hypothetical protein